MIPKKTLALFGLISILIACRSTHRTVDKVSTSTKEVQRSVLRNDITTEGISTIQTIDRGSQLTVESQTDSTEVIIERLGDKIIVTGAKKIQIDDRNEITTEKTETSTNVVSEGRTDTVLESNADTVSREIKRKGIPIFVWVALGLVAIAFVIYKKGGIFGFNINIKKSNNDKD